MEDCLYKQRFNHEGVNPFGNIRLMGTKQGAILKNWTNWMQNMKTTMK